MMGPRILLTLLAFFCLCSTGLAQLSHTTPETQKTCKEFSKTQLPEADRPTPEEASALSGCVSEDLYYGIGQPADLVKARKCAYVEMDARSDMIFEGPSILMMAYANGKGAVRNIDVALRLACEVEGTPDEIEGRIADLQKMKKEANPDEDFDLCDHMASGLMMAACNGHHERVAEDERQAQISSITSKWSASEKRALHALQSAFDKFVQARTHNEVLGGGWSLIALAISEESTLRESFVDDLKRFEKRQLPHFTVVQFSRADASLNAAYSKIQRLKDFGDYPVVTQQGIRATQRVWLQYRDAWVAFGQKRYPAVSANSWKTWFTQKRTKMLKDFL